jgi:hypothetical protein
MSDEKNSPESVPQSDEIRDLEPKQADGHSDAPDDDVKGGRKAGGGQQDYLTVTMSDVLISS